MNNGMPYNIIDFFAGLGLIAKLGEQYGYASAKHDILYSSALDMNKSSGFVQLILFNRPSHV
jgi:hypothetical protein